MSQNANVNAYLRTKVLTASQEELRLMLLDGAIKFARQGAEGLARKDFEGMYNGVSQCRNIIFELLTTVRDDLDAELARNVKSLYTFLYTELLDASMEKSQDKLASVIELLEYERQTWVLLMQRLSQEKAGAVPGAPGGDAPTRPTLSLQG